VLGGFGLRSDTGETSGVETSVARSVQRVVSMPTASGTPRRTTSQPMPVSVQTWAGPGAMPVAGARTVQREETNDEAPPTEAPAPQKPADAPVESPPATAGETSRPPAPPPPGPPEPDELAKALFDPLLRRLRTEFRLDRERRGMVTDRW
jgi:hypothetical protein